MKGKVNFEISLTKHLHFVRMNETRHEQCTRAVLSVLPSTVPMAAKHVLYTGALTTEFAMHWSVHKYTSCFQCNAESLFFVIVAMSDRLVPFMILQITHFNSLHSELGAPYVCNVHVCRVKYMQGMSLTFYLKKIFKFLGKKNQF